MTETVINCSLFYKFYAFNIPLLKYLLNNYEGMIFRLRLFLCKIFFITKYFQIKMISGKIIFFPCLVAFQKMLRKIFYSVVRKIEQKEWG